MVPVIVAMVQWRQAMAFLQVTVRQVLSIQVRQHTTKQPAQKHLRIIHVSYFLLFSAIVSK